MSHYAVTAVGADRPGIVAAVTGALFASHCNLEDCSMSLLRGHFAMMLVVSGPDSLSESSLESALGPVASDLALVVTARRIDDDVPISPHGEPWTVSVYGADRPGIVHDVTMLLADAGVNIEDLDTRVIGDPDAPVYAMVLDVRVPGTVDFDAVMARLSARASELGVECSAHRSQADVL